jgi:hypothetical protein
VAEFLGWTNVDRARPKGIKAQERVEDSLSALQFIEEGYLKLSDLEGLTVTIAKGLFAKRSRSAGKG